MSADEKCRNCGGPVALDTNAPKGWTHTYTGLHGCSLTPDLMPVAEPLDTDFPATWMGGHALVIEFGDEEILARCQCGKSLGGGSPAISLDNFIKPWERHVMTRERTP